MSPIIKKIIKVFKIILLSAALLFLIVVAVVNLPFVHNFITAKTNSILNEKGIPLHIGKISLLLNGKIGVKEVTMIQSPNDTILYTGSLKIDINPIPLLTKKLVINKIALNSAVIYLLTDTVTGNLKISQVFGSAADTTAKSKPEMETDEKNKPWEIQVGEIQLKKVNFKYSDSVNGILVKQNLDNAVIDFDNFSLVKKQIDVDKLVLDNPVGLVSIWKGKNSSEEVSNSSTEWKFSLNDLEINDLLFTLDQPDSKESTEISLKKGSASLKKLDLATHEILVRKINFREPEIRITRNPEKNVESEPVSIDSLLTLPVIPWIIKADKLNIEDGWFDMETLNAEMVKDLESWLPVNHLNLTLNNFELSPKSYNLNIESLKLYLSEILEIESGALGFSADSLQNVNLKVDISAQLNEKNGWFGKKTKLNLNTEINGNKNALNIDNMDVTSSNGIDFSINGRILKPFQLEEARYDLNFKSGTISKQNLESIIKYFSPNTQIPGFNWVTLSGEIMNSVLNPYLKIKINSDAGIVEADGNYNIKGKSGEINTDFQNIHLAGLMGEKYPENLTGNLHLKGKMNNNRLPEAEADIQIDSVTYKSVTTNNIALNATIKNDTARFALKSSDSKLNIDIDGQIENKMLKNYSGNIKGLIDIDLFALHFSDSLFSGKTSFNSNFSYNPESVTFSARFDSLFLINQNDSADIKSTSLAVTRSDTIFSTDLNSDFIDLHFISHASLNELKGMLDYIEVKNLVNLDSANFINAGILENISDFRFDANINHGPVFRLFFPDSVLNFANIVANLSKTENDSLAIGNISSDWLNYNKIISYKPTVLLRFEPQKIAFEIKTDSIVEDKIKFGKTSLKLGVLPSDISGELAVYNLSDSLMNNIGFQVERHSTSVIFKSSLPKWILNKNPWTLSPLQFLTWDKSSKSFIASLDLSFNESRIKLAGNISKSVDLSLNKFELKNFRLPWLTDYLPDGIIDGNVNYKNAEQSDIGFDLQFNQLVWKGMEINQLNTKGKVVADSTGIISGDVTLHTDDSTSLSIEMNTNKSNNEYSIKSKFNQFHFKLIEPFIRQYASNMQGKADGEINISGKGKKPDIEGEIRFKDLGMKVVPLKIWLKSTNNKIEIKNNNLLFDNFTVRDSLNRPLTINGNILFDDINNITTSLKIDADNLTLMNTTEADNNEFFGKIIVKTELNISGPLASPVIKGNINLESGTKLTYQLIQDLTVQKDQNDIVFAEITDSLDVKYPTNTNKKITKMPMIETTIGINPKSIFNVKISEIYNVDITVMGNGLLNYNMMPNNTMSLNGDYKIESGSCDLKITGWPLKTFKITRGSLLTWNGSIDNPELNLEATSSVKGSYLNPIDNKSRTVDFIVSMKLKNQLSKLEIVFDIQSNDQYITSVINSLSEDDKMRQAINLLLFETIDIPGIESSGSYLSSQISSFWENQLNSLTKSTLKNTHLSFGIDTYTETTQAGSQEKTSFTYEMEHKFLNDRATVKISGKLYDYNDNSTYQTNSLFENFSFEYALDSLNTKNIKIYQKKDYEDLLEGEVTKYGVGFLYRKSYNSLKEIWQGKKKKKQNKVIN